jgi:ABC-2 type transport system permease protein
MKEANQWLFWICSLNPFSYAIELIRFTLYLQWNPTAFAIVTATTAGFIFAGIAGYNPRSGLLGRKPTGN